MYYFTNHLEALKCRNNYFMLLKTKNKHYTGYYGKSNIF